MLPLLHGCPTSEAKQGLLRTHSLVLGPLLQSSLTWLPLSEDKAQMATRRLCQELRLCDSKPTHLGSTAFPGPRDSPHLMILSDP